jgi:hypothetical protein
MDSLHIANMAAHGGKRKALAHHLLLVQEALDNLAPFAGNDRISPDHMIDWAQALERRATRAEASAAELHKALRNIDVHTPLSIEELGLEADALYR